ncbi:hypothetical protein ACJMK2_022483 [Sinanodonta woodiana]|uniref:C1q domain-containing protein n=1 Tax=Sinanodonta woodiana TaxID=1069815 RepID=A0ABD3TK11_SINWO
MNDVYIRSHEIQTSLEKTIDIAKSMIQSMEIKLSEAQQYIVMLEDKLRVCGQNTMLTEHLEIKLTPSDDASKEHRKIVKERLFKSEYDQLSDSERLNRMLVRIESRLSNIDEFQAKLHKAESAISRVEEKLEKKMKALEYRPVAIIQKSDMAQNASPSDVPKTAITQANSDNDVFVDQWKDKMENKINHVYSLQASDVSTGIFRGLRATTQDRVAFRVSGILKYDGHYSGERIMFTSVDYNEGSGYDMTSGTFTCPTTGTYFFTATIGSISSVGISATLKMDGVAKMSLYAGYHLQGDKMSTAVTIAHCRAGQSVCLEVGSGDHLGGFESMSGFLLWPDITSS